MQKKNQLYSCLHTMVILPKLLTKAQFLHVSCLVHLCLIPSTKVYPNIYKADVLYPVKRGNQL